MKINVVGCGKMGEVYVRNLINNLKFNPSDVFVCDIKKEKARKLAGIYGAGFVDAIADLPVAPAIVTTTTPGHVDAIEKLARRGVENIFCEKPLCLNRSEAKRILAVGNNVYVAYLMRFSSAVNYIFNLMASENLHLSEATGQWGLNFYHNQRPLIGTLTDESVHEVDIISMLAEVNQEIKKIKVSAILTYPNYADRRVQEEAQKFDRSIPDKPDASAFAQIKFMTSYGILPASICSSFILPQQTRRVSGILSNNKNELAYAFEINFDAEAKTKDHLVITKYENAEVVEKFFPCTEKIADETRAFLDVTNGHEPDKRLVDAKQALRSLSFTEAMRESQGDDNKWVYVV